MASPESSPPPQKRGFHWIWIVLALVIGLAAGLVLRPVVAPPRAAMEEGCPCVTTVGTCYNRDGQPVGQNVPQSACHCTGCTWQRNQIRPVAPDR